MTPRWPPIKCFHPMAIRGDHSLSEQWLASLFTNKHFHAEKPACCKVWPQAYSWPVSIWQLHKTEIKHRNLSLLPWYRWTLHSPVRRELDGIPPQINLTESSFLWCNTMTSKVLSPTIQCIIQLPISDKLLSKLSSKFINHLSSSLEAQTVDLALLPRAKSKHPGHINQF